MVASATMILISSTPAQPDTSLPSKVAIVISGGTVIEFGQEAKILRRHKSHQIITLPGCILLPGLVNVHTHLELPPLLESIRSRNYTDWVLNLLKKKKTLNNRDYTSAAGRNIRTLLETGTTTAAEICSHNLSSDALKQAGMRSVLYHEIISMNPDVPLPRLSSILPRATALTRNGLSPHAPHTVSSQVLERLRLFSIQNNIPISMHVAESKDEIRLLQRRRSEIERLYKAARWDLSWAPQADSPFRYLADLGLLGPRFLAVHAVQTSKEDIEIIRKTKTRIAHCPRSNSEIGVGRMPLKAFLNAGITVGLGTDSLASSPSLNLWDEMRYALKIHRRDGVTAEDIFRIATAGGAKALGLDREIGNLSPGKRADIIAVPLPVRNTGDIYSDLLRETNSCIMTMVNGKILYRR